MCRCHFEHGTTPGRKVTARGPSWASRWNASIHPRPREDEAVPGAFPLIEPEHARHARDERPHAVADDRLESLAQGETLSVELRRLGDEMAGVARAAGAKLPLHGSGAVLAARKRDHPLGIEVTKVSERRRELRARLRVRQELDPPRPLLRNDEAPDERLFLGHRAPAYKGRRE